MDAVESVNVFKSAYQAEYGRFSGGLTTVETKAPSSQWSFELNDFVPTPRIVNGHVVGILDDTPRLYFSGPLWRDKLTFSESLTYDFVHTPVRGLPYPAQRNQASEGFTSFTDFYYVFSPQHFAALTSKYFPTGGSMTTSTPSFRNPPRPIMAKPVTRSGSTITGCSRAEEFSRPSCSSPISTAIRTARARSISR